MKDKIEDFLTSELMFEFDDEITRDTDLFKAGMIDSMGYIKLIRFLESEFAIRFTEMEMLTNVLVSCNGIAACVAAKTGKAA